MPKASELLTAPRASEAVGTGSVSLTQRMRRTYTDVNTAAQTGGEAAPNWNEWLNSQGYALDKNGLVFKTK